MWRWQHARASRKHVVCSLRVVYAGIAGKINCFCLLVAYFDTETMVPARALVARNPRSGLQVITLPSLAAGVDCVTMTCCQCCRPTTNVLQPHLIPKIWQIIPFLLSPFVPAHLCRGEHRYWLFVLPTQWSAGLQVFGLGLSCFCIKQNCMIVRWYVYALHAVLLDCAVLLFFAAFFTLDASAFSCCFRSRFAFLLSSSCFSLFFASFSSSCWMHSSLVRTQAPCW